jgi:hypothetical protein
MLRNGWAASIITAMDVPPSDKAQETYFYNLQRLDDFTKYRRTLVSDQFIKLLRKSVSYQSTFQIGASGFIKVYTLSVATVTSLAGPHIAEALTLFSRSLKLRIEVLFGSTATGDENEATAEVESLFGELQHCVEIAQAYVEPTGFDDLLGLYTSVLLLIGGRHGNAVLCFARLLCFRSASNTSVLKFLHSVRDRLPRNARDPPTTDRSFILLANLCDRMVLKFTPADVSYYVQAESSSFDVQNELLRTFFIRLLTMFFQKHGASVPLQLLPSLMCLEGMTPDVMASLSETLLFSSWMDALVVAFMQTVRVQRRDIAPDLAGFLIDVLSSPTIRQEQGTRLLDSVLFLREFISHFRDISRMQLRAFPINAACVIFSVVQIDDVYPAPLELVKEMDLKDALLEKLLQFLQAAVNISVCQESTAFIRSIQNRQDWFDARFHLFCNFPILKCVYTGHSIVWNMH